MENKIPGDHVDELNDKLPDFMANLANMKKQLSAVPEMLKKFETLAAGKIKIKEKKRAVLNGKNVDVTLMDNGEVFIRWQDIGEGENFYNSLLQWDYL